MSNQAGIDRRCERRVNAEMLISVRHAQDSGSAVAQDVMARNVSLSGAYFEGPAGEVYQANEILIVSAAIPESMRRQFPFTRLAGRGRVVRAVMLEGKDRRQGVALEFEEDLTVLSAVSR